MKTETVRSNILVLFSVAFFLFTSAFTLIPESNNATASTQSICWMCSFIVEPYGVCAPAQYCGMDGICLAGSPCVQTGGLCGECADDPPGDGDGPVVIEDPGTP